MLPDIADVLDIGNMNKRGIHTRLENSVSRQLVRNVPHCIFIYQVTVRSRTVLNALMYKHRSGRLQSERRR